MTPEQKLKWAALLWVKEHGYGEKQDYLEKASSPPTGEEIDHAWDALYEEDGDSCADGTSEIRGSFTEETGLPCEYSRHYEAKAVAAEMPDGSWVGWTYWYGGGKHGEPGEVDWMEYAYDLTYGEETRTVKVWQKIG